MTIFDLLFLVAALASLTTLATAGVLALRGKFKEAIWVLTVYGVCLAVYLATGLAVSLIKPQRVIAMGDPWCFDDWCLTAESVQKTSVSLPPGYVVNLRISSRARGITQRANGAWIYLIDAKGRRYAPEPDPSQPPLDIRLGPGESVATARTFRVPDGVHQLGLITGHGGPYCGPMAFAAIGDSGCLFRKPAMIRIQ